MLDALVGAMGSDRTACVEHLSFALFADIEDKIEAIDWYASTCVSSRILAGDSSPFFFFLSVQHLRVHSIGLLRRGIRGAKDVALP